jgi:hypothetical protein
MATGFAGLYIKSWWDTAFKVGILQIEGVVLRCHRVSCTNRLH